MNFRQEITRRVIVSLLHVIWQIMAKRIPATASFFLLEKLCILNQLMAIKSTLASQKLVLCSHSEAGNLPQTALKLHSKSSARPLARRLYFRQSLFPLVWCWRRERKLQEKYGCVKSWGQDARLRILPEPFFLCGFHSCHA